MKKLLLTVTAAAVVFASTAAVWANEEIRVYRDGQEMSFDVSPQIIEDRTFVPMRAIFEKFGMEVDWDGNTQTVIATGNGNEISMTVGNMSFLRNGEEIILDVPTQIVEDRTLVPVRAISESLDCEVKWDGDERKVSIISSPDKIIGTATVENMNCLIDYQPIGFVNIDGYTYLKATDLDKYGFDVTEENGDVYIKRNKNKLPLLIDEYKGDLIKEEYHVHSNDFIYPHSVMELWKEPLYGKEFDVFHTDKNVYIDNNIAISHNVNGEMYIHSDELQRFGNVQWIEAGMNVAFYEHIYFHYREVKNELQINLKRDEKAIHFSDISDDYAGLVTYSYSAPNRLWTRGYCQHKDGKRNGYGYYISYFQEMPDKLYEAGEYEDDKLKNGVIVENNLKKGCLDIYEVKDFEQTQLYPKE